MYNIQDVYSFYAIFERSQEYPSDTRVTITFPDLPGAISDGDNQEDGKRMARECLALFLITLLNLGKKIPSPSRPSDFTLSENETLCLIETKLSDFFPSEFQKLLTSNVSKKRGGKREGAGRPRKNSSSLASRQLIVRLTQHEFEALETLAETENTTKSALIKRWICEKSTN